MAESDSPAVRLGRVFVGWLVTIVGLAVLGVTVNAEVMFGIGVIFGFLAAAEWAGVPLINRPISIPFALSFIAIMLLIVEYLLPASVVSAFPDIGALVGVPLRDISALKMFVVMIAALVVMWTWELRRTERAVKPETITKRLRSQFENLLETYVTMGRIVAGFFLAGLFILSRELGVLAGEAGAWFGDVPFITSTVTLGGAGWISLGGELLIIGSVPLLSTMTATEWAVFAFLVVFVATAARFAD